MVSTFDISYAARARIWSGDIWSMLGKEVIPWILSKQAQALITAFLKDRDCAASANALPRQTKA